jgi:hypothetical protein
LRALAGTHAVPLGYWDARLLRPGRGAAQAVLLRAGAYVSGDLGSNACPAGSVRIETEAACRTAAAAAGKTPGSPFVFSDAYYPRGCETSGNYAYFNVHADGAGSYDAQLLCAKIACTVAQVVTLASAKDQVAAVMGLVKDPAATDCGTCILQCGDVADPTTCALGCTAKPFAKGPCSGKQIADLNDSKDATVAVMGLMNSKDAAAKDCGMCAMGCANAADKVGCVILCVKPKAAGTHRALKVHLKGTQERVLQGYSRTGT